MKKAAAVISFTVSFLLFQNCAPSRFVKTLNKKQNAISVSFGGPVILFSGVPTPIPYLTFLYAYGLNSKVTLFGGMNFTSALFGNAQTEIGATFKIHEWDRGFGISVSPGLQIAYNLANQSDFRAWPSLDLNAYFHPKQKPSYVYAGLNAWFELSAQKAHLETQLRKVLPNLQIGYTVVKQKWQHQFEFKYLGIGIQNTPGVVEYVGLDGKGSFGIYYSLVRKF